LSFFAVFKGHANRRMAYLLALECIHANFNYIYRGMIHTAPIKIKRRAMEKDSKTPDDQGGIKTTQGEDGNTPAAYCGGVDARRVLEGMAIDPLIGMAELARDPEVDSKTRAKIYMELAQYIYEKKKPGNPEEAVQMETYEERLRRIRGGENSMEWSHAQAGDEEQD
jgi:hypothetical protein